MKPFTQILNDPNRNDNRNNYSVNNGTTLEQVPDELLKAIEKFYNQQAQSNRPEITSTNG